MSPVTQSEYQIAVTELAINVHWPYADDSLPDVSEQPAKTFAPDRSKHTTDHRYEISLGKLVKTGRLKLFGLNQLILSNNGRADFPGEIGSVYGWAKIKINGLICLIEVSCGIFYATDRHTTATIITDREMAKPVI